MGLVFMGAIVAPVYLVPALTATLALGLAAEAHPKWLPTVTRSPHARTPGELTDRALAARKPGPEPASTTRRLPADFFYPSYSRSRWVAAVSGTCPNRMRQAGL